MIENTPKLFALRNGDGRTIQLRGCTDFNGLPVSLPVRSWAPDFTWAGGNTGLVYTSSGTYEVIEDRVFINFDITVTNKGSSTGQARVSNLPEPQVGGDSVVAYVFHGGTSALASPSVLVTAGNMNFYQQATTGAAIMTDANCPATPSTFRLRGQFNYRLAPN